MSAPDTTEITQTIHIPQQSIPASLRCRHINSEGRRCGSPSLRGENLCYHHHQTRRPAANLRERRARQAAFTLPAPNSRPEIQQAIGSIMLRLAGNDIDTRRAGLLLYALQIAQANLTEHQRLQTARPTPQSHANPASQQELHPQHTQPGQPQDCFEQTTKATQSNPQRNDPTSSIPTHNHCHPERSEAQSKDPRFDPPPANPHSVHYGSGPTPDLDHPTPIPATPTDFTPPPPQWRRLSPAVGAALLDAFCRQATARSEPTEDPHPASSPDRSPDPHPGDPYTSQADPSAPHPPSGPDPCTA